MAAVTWPARHAGSLATSASNREPRRSKVHRAMEWLKPSSAPSSVIMSASVRARMQTPSCTSYQLGSLTTTRFTRTRHSDIVHPVSSSQLTETRDHVRSFGGYNMDAPPAWTKNWNLEWPVFIVLFLMLFGMVAFSKAIFSGGLRTIRRYLRRRRAELLEPAIAAEIDLLLGWSAIVSGCLWLFLSVLAALYILVLLGSYLEVWSRLEDYPLFYERGPRLDMVARVIAALALLSLGVGTVRWGYRRLRPFRPALGFMQPNAVQRRRRDLLLGSLRIIGGGIVLLAVMFF